MNGCLAPLLHTNPESVAVNRLISLMFVFVHRLKYLYTVQAQLNSSSLGHCCNAASYCLIFCKTFFCSHCILKKALDKIHSLPADEQSTPTRHPFRENASNMLDERIDKDSFDVPQLPLQTLAKLPMIIMERTAPIKFSRPDILCTGKHFKVYEYITNKKLSQIRCYYPDCNSKTSWYCVRCKQWFCMEKKL